MYNKIKGKKERKRRRRKKGIIGEGQKKEKTKIPLCDSELSISVLLSVWLEVVMAAMLCELFGLALASGL